MKTTQNVKTYETTNTNHLIIEKARFMTLGSILLVEDYFIYLSNSNTKSRGLMKHLLIILTILFLIILNTSLSKAQCHIEDWTALKALYESTDGDNWTDRSGWETNIANRSFWPVICDLGELYGVKLDPISKRVIALDLSGKSDYEASVFGCGSSQTSTPSVTQQGYNAKDNLKGNNLDGVIPPEIGLLRYLTNLALVNDNLSGTIPQDLAALEDLTSCALFGNKLTGDIPEFQNTNCLSLQENYFTCSDIQNFDYSNIDDFRYSPQYFTHNYEPFIADKTNSSSFEFGFTASTLPNDCVFLYQTNQLDVLNTINSTQTSQNQSPIVGNSYDILWKKNDVVIFGESDLRLEINVTEPSDAGIYTLHIYNENMVAMELISDPIYVIYPGYDLYGQPVAYNQIMVEFDNQSNKIKYQNEILFPNSGWVFDKCNCNREIYLWQFPSTETTAQALIEIDKKVKKSSNDDGDVDGGLNNILELGELTNNNYMPNAVDSSPSTNQDDVVIFILDTGLDDNFKNSPYLYDQAPYDNCYSGIESASAYSYIGGSPINSDYIDEVWHGTFGYDVITKEFNPNDNIKVVPLKIFNDQGQGNLFDLTCAIYHAIDHNANIVNISAGYYGQHSSILENAINYARESDVFICTATGNDYDTLTQYPAKFANQYHYIYDDSTQELIDSVRYSNIISVASLDAQNNVSIFSNVGNSTTLFAYGEDIEGMGLQGELLSASGTSMAAFLVSRELALEIANDNTRTYGQIFNDFEANRLVYYDNAEFSSITGKRLDISLTQTNTRLAKPTENQKKIINVYKEDQVTNTAELNTITISNNKMDLIYTTNEAGTLNGKLYGINGRFLATLGEINLQANEQYIIKNAVKQKDNLMGILWLQYKTDNGEIIYSNKKIMFTK